MKSLLAICVVAAAAAILHVFVPTPALGQDTDQGAEPPQEQFVAPQRAANAPGVTDEEIDKAIERGIAWLFSQQGADGIWPFREAPDAKGVKHSVTGSRWPPGEHCMAMYALEYANTSLDNDKFQKGLKLLLEMNLTHNYMIATRIATLAHLYQRSPNEKRPAIRAAMKKDVDQIIANQGKIGGWRYGGPPIPPRAIDFSNTQLCVLALSEAMRCGIEIPVEPIMRVHKRIIEDQLADGGWNYGCNEDFRKDRSYGNMTAACVASLFLTTEMLTGAVGCPCRGGRSPKAKDIVGDVLDKGMAWMNKEFRADTSPYGYHWFYWIYQAERVGMATGYRYFAEHDWYREIAQILVSKQNAAGTWGNTVDTSFALLFLIKGRAPILYNKLQYTGDWNLHQHDLRNLCEYIGRAKEQAIAWQVVQEQTPEPLWHDAPVLFITTEAEFKITDELKKKLRAYTDNGGTLLLEPSCGSGTARTFWTNLIKELWPEWELTTVPREHPVWEADVAMRGRRPVFMHVNDGIRSFIFYAPADISCQWHTDAVSKNREIFDFGENLAAYASDKAKLRSRISGQRNLPGTGVEGQTPKAGPKAALVLAHLKDAGDWYVGKNYKGLPMLAGFARTAAGLNVTYKEEVDPATDDLSGCDVLWVNGRQGFSLAPDAAAKVKARLESGGFLVAEATMGDERFVNEFTTAAQGMGLALKPITTSDPLLTGAMGDGTGYNIAEKVRFSRALMGKRIGQPFASLVGLYLGDRLVGVLSPYDVSYSLTGCKAWDRLGYDPDYAMAVGTNLLVLASTRK